MTFYCPCKAKEDALHPGLLFLVIHAVELQKWSHESIIEAVNGKTILEVFRNKTSVI